MSGTLVPTPIVPTPKTQDPTPPSAPPPLVVPSVEPRTISIEMEDEGTHELPITDARAGAAPEPAPQDVPKDESLPESDLPIADEESPWLALVIIVVVVVLIASGIVFAISRLRSSGGDTPPVEVSSSVTPIATVSEVMDFTPAPNGPDGFSFTWRIPEGLQVDGFLFTLTNLSTATTTVSNPLESSATSTSASALAPGTTYQAKLQVKTGESLSTGSILEVTPEGDSRSPSERDAQRRDDLENVTAALDAYYAKNAKFPAATNYRALLSRLISDGYLSTQLNDPQSPLKGYTYLAGANRATYTLSAALEEPAADAPGGILTVTPKTAPSIPPTQPPVSALTISTKPASLVGAAPFKVMFTLEGTSAARAVWNFGDGTNGAGPSVTHIFNKAGLFAVTATVKGANGDQTVRSSVTVLASGTTTDPRFRDADADGLSDDQEREYGTNPNVKDTDQDGFTDKQEVNGGYNPLDADRAVDSDGDGLLNWEEVQKYRSDPFKADTDNDTFPDGVEVRNGYNPAAFNKK